VGANSFCWWPKPPTPASLQNSYVLSLRALLTLGHAELHALTFSQGLKTLSVDCSEVYEYIRALVLLDEAETFSLVEPFYLASADVRHNKFPK
jgi:hypothetical protein